MFTWLGCRRIITVHSYDPDRDMVDESQHKITINSLAYHAILMALTTTFPPSAIHLATNKHLLPFVKYLWTSHDTPTCYLLSHCQFEHSVYLGTPSVAKRCLHSYQHLHCDYSATVITLSVLELVQLADVFRFIVLCEFNCIMCLEFGSWDHNTLVKESWKIF